MESRGPSFLSLGTCIWWGIPTFFFYSNEVFIVFCLFCFWSLKNSL